MLRADELRRRLINAIHLSSVLAGSEADSYRDGQSSTDKAGNPARVP